MSLIVALIVVSVSGKIEGKTWSVPSGAPTIQAAVDSCAVDGDAIVIAAGVYHQGSIVVDGKNISIDQSGGPATIIAPSMGVGTFIKYKNTTAGALRSVIIRDFGTAVAIDNASGMVSSSGEK